MGGLVIHLSCILSCVLVFRATFFSYYNIHVTLLVGIFYNFCVTCTPLVLTWNNQWICISSTELILVAAHSLT